MEKLVNKNILARIVAEEHDLPPHRAEAFVEEVFLGITAALSQGSDVNISGFGKFKVKVSPERKVRNIATGELMVIPSKIRVSFSPSSHLKERVSK